MSTYSKFTWADKSDITVARLNNIEGGIDALYNGAGSLRMARNGARVRAASDRGPNVAGTPLAMIFSTIAGGGVRYDDDGRGGKYFDDAQPTRLTPPRAGIYLLGFQVAVLSNGSATSVQTRIIHVTGAGATRTICGINQIPTLANGVTNYFTPVVTEPVALGDWFEFEINSAGATVTAKAANNYGIEAFIQYLGE